MINFTPRISFIIATKRHSKRFYRADNKIISNTQPGDVVASGVTQTEVSEFFLQSHHPLKGKQMQPQLACFERTAVLRRSENATVHDSRQRTRHERWRDPGIRQYDVKRASSQRVSGEFLVLLGGTSEEASTI